MSGFNNEDEDWGALPSVTQKPKLPSALRYAFGPRLKEITNLELLNQLLSDTGDPLSDIVERDTRGRVIGFLPGATQATLDRRIVRINNALQKFDPYTHDEVLALRRVLKRYGIEREVPDLKRERSR